MNDQTKLVFALEHVAHLYDLIDGNEWQQYLTEHLVQFESELERQRSLELKRKSNQPCPPRKSAVEARKEQANVNR